MTYAYVLEIAPRLSTLPSGPFANLHELRAMGEPAVRDSRLPHEQDIAIRTRAPRFPPPDGERDNVLRGLLYIYAIRSGLGV